MHVLFKKIALQFAVFGFMLVGLMNAAYAQKIVFGFSASTAFANAFVAANEGIFKKVWA